MPRRPDGGVRSDNTGGYSMNDADSIRKGFETYTEGVEKSLGKFPERKKKFVTGSNATVEQIGRAHV